MNVAPHINPVSEAIAPSAGVASNPKASTTPAPVTTQAPVNNGAAPSSTGDSFTLSTTPTVDLLGNMPGQTPVSETPTAVDAALLDFFPTNENTVLFGSGNLASPGGLGLQVLIADGADPNFNVALAALAAQNPDAVVGMLEALSNNAYNVNFYLAAQPQAGDPNATMRQVQVQVTDGFLPSNLPQDAQGNSIMWAALVNKAYAKLADMGMVNAGSDPLSTMTGRQVTVLGTGTSSEALWSALSLANAPLHVPVTTFSGPAEAHTEAGLQANKSFNVLGTSLDANGEPMVTLHRPGMLNMSEASEILKVPLETLQKSVTVTVVADGKPDMDLLNPNNPLHGAAASNCCMHARTSSDNASHGNDSLRVFDAPTRLQEQRCMSCAFARNMCLPQAS